MNRVTIRDGRESDLQDINQLIFRLITKLDKKEGIDREFISHNSGSLFRSDRSHFLVAQAGKIVIGFVHFTTRETITHLGPSGLIDKLVVATRFRRRRIGSKLLSATIQKCRELGCREIEVSTEGTNREARAFYERCGFEERGILLEKDLT